MLNKVTLIGNLGTDPEVRYLPTGGAVANINLATTLRWKDKQSGERKESTEWHRIVLYNRLAEIAGEYLKKGRQVYIEGRLQTRKWQGQDGQDRYTTEIIANELHMLGNRTGGTSEFGGSEPTQANTMPVRPPQATQPGPSPAYNPAASAPPHYDDFDDDIPF